MNVLNVLEIIPYNLSPFSPIILYFIIIFHFALFHFYFAFSHFFQEPKHAVESKLSIILRQELSYLWIACLFQKRDGNRGPFRYLRRPSIPIFMICLMFNIATLWVLCPTHPMLFSYFWLKSWKNIPISSYCFSSSFFCSSFRALQIKKALKSWKSSFCFIAVGRDEFWFLFKLCFCAQHFSHNHHDENWLWTCCERPSKIF